MHRVEEVRVQQIARLVAQAAQQIIDAVEGVVRSVRSVVPEEGARGQHAAPRRRHWVVQAPPINRSALVVVVMPMTVRSMVMRLGPPPRPEGVVPVTHFGAFVVPSAWDGSLGSLSLAAFRPGLVHLLHDFRGDGLSLHG
eukprot:scaffold1651_cov317-Pinguiococcus_pyrenoidosus.AAC.7